MALFVVEYEAQSAIQLQVVMNAALALLLNHTIYSVNFFTVMPDLNTPEYKAVIMYDDAGAVITTPYRVIFFQQATLPLAVTAAQTYVTANAGQFMVEYPIAAFNMTITSSFVFVVFNTNFANGEANWAAGGSGGGGFNGQITVNPLAVLTVIDSAAMTSLKAIAWHFEAVKGTNTYSSIINASNDGTTPTHVEANVSMSPGNGTFDFTTNVDAAAGLMRLTVTPSTVGWTIRVRRFSELSA